MNAASTLLWVALGLSHSLSAVRAADPTTENMDPKKILESIPKDVMKGLAGDESARKEAMDAATRKLLVDYKDQMATLRCSVHRTSKMDGHYNLFTSEERLRFAGVNFKVNYAIYLEESENAKGAKLKSGDKITASGKAFVSIHGGGNNTFLSITVSKAKLQ